MSKIRHPFSARDEVQQATRALMLLIAYVTVLTACRYVSYEVRFDFLVPKEFQTERLTSLALSIPVKLAFLVLFRQFGSLLTYFSVPDLVRIAAAMTDRTQAQCHNTSCFFKHRRWRSSFQRALRKSR